MGTKKIKVDSDLYERAKIYADSAGYSSVDEFFVHILEKLLSGSEEGGDSIEEVEKRLRGLGYIA